MVRTQDIDQMLDGLASVRPIFHSEADFQHALAWRIHELNPAAAIRLEYRPLPQRSMYVDIWVRSPDTSVAIELKYPCRKLDVEIDGEHFVLKDQAAQPHPRYDFVKDLTRLEDIVAQVPDTMGFAVMLTNDSSYWTPSGRESPVDAAFRLSEGRILGGSLRWAQHVGLGTARGREALLSLHGAYSLTWREYSMLLVDRPYNRFRLLVVPVRRLA